MKIEQIPNVEFEIHTKSEFQNDVLVDGEVELLMSILPDLLRELMHVTEVL